MKPVKSGLDSISRYLRTKKEVGRRKIGLLVDGPNILRKEFDVNLEEIRDVLEGLREYQDRTRFPEPVCL